MLRRKHRNGAAGRPFSDTMHAFDGGIPRLVQPEEVTVEGVTFPTMWHARGAFERGRGWSVVKEPPLKVYRATTDEAGLLLPFLTTPELPATGVPMGINVRSGSGFFVDVRRWVRDGHVSNPNIMIFGKPGMGKSGTVKPYVRRSIAYGYKAFISGDLKEEYADLCREFGQEEIIIGAGMPARVNALDTGVLAQGWDSLGLDARLSRFEVIRKRWLVLLEATMGAVGVVVDPVVREALSHTIDDLVAVNRSSMPTVPDITIPEVWAALRDPSEQLIRECRFDDVHDMRHYLRLATSGLNNLCTGVLKGMFDERTNVEMDWDAPIGAVSLKRLQPLGDQAVGVGITVMNSWTRGMTEMSKPGTSRIIVRDEVWRQMRQGAGAVKSLDADLRLSRDDRTIQVLALHKPSDLGSVGDSGSEANAIAQQLWALCDTKILLAQEREVALELQEQLGLTDLETAQMPGWCWKRKGNALWKVGDSSFKVAGSWAGIERQLFETNDEPEAATHDIEVPA